MMVQQNSPQSLPGPSFDDAVVIPMKEVNQDAVSDLNQLKKALFFVWVGEIWNLLKAAVAL
jgi:hypothetical protein